MRSAPLRSVLVAAGLAASISFAAAEDAPDYGGYHQGVFLPFLDDQGSGIDRTPTIGLSFGGRVHRAVLDSGSTGVVVAASLIPDFDQLAAVGPGKLTYTSSGRVRLGQWVVTPVTLVGEDETTISTTPMPVLAVTEVRCLRDARDCTPNDSPRDIAMVGVGFGREGDAQSQSTPDKNPLLQVAGDGKPLRRGYILGHNGVQVGLTGENTGGSFTFVKLQRSPDLNDWSAVPACISLDGLTPPACGTMLVDTGVSAMFLTVPPAQANGMTGSLPPGTKVAIGLDVPGGQTELYSFAVEGASALAPSATHLRVADDRTFVNTSFHFLNGFDVLYDADGGYAGFRRR
jgi:hypothetical protein